MIGPLDLDENATAKLGSAQPMLDFASTLSEGSLSLMRSWSQDCVMNHKKCQKIFGGNRLRQSFDPWFPDRLVYVTRMKTAEISSPGRSMSTLKARVVLRSDPRDFPPETVSVKYLSLSHCWGPAPDPSAPFGGRAGTVLTELNLSAWQINLPLDELPLTFRHAIMTCAALGFDYIWIDSLCILQDSVRDWQEQSAVMGDVYKYAWLNVAALSSASDSEGFINENRDPRAAFGFRAPFASILGRERDEKNANGQSCVLLHGNAKLQWPVAPGNPRGSSTSGTFLFRRAWVFQERNLARRTLGFDRDCVYWACDESSDGELGGDYLKSSNLRATLHSVLEIATTPGSTGLREAARSMLETTGTLSVKSADEKATPAIERTIPESLRSVLRDFDDQWDWSISTYTNCKLTRHTDKLVAISSVARELAPIAGKTRYLAGLWDVNLPSQMGWRIFHGRNVPPRKRVGDAEYIAPSWSWASVDAPTGLDAGGVLISSDMSVALADVRAADVELETDYAFGSVKAGWLRIWGCLNRVRAVGLSARWDFGPGNRGPEDPSLTDEATGEKLRFWPDTMEGHEFVESCEGVHKLVWMPLKLVFHKWTQRSLSGLVLVEVPPEESIGGKDGFVKAGEKVYERLGYVDTLGCSETAPHSKLFSGLGAYPIPQTEMDRARELAGGFRRSEEGFEEFVLI